MGFALVFVLFSLWTHLSNLSSSKIHTSRNKKMKFTSSILFATSLRGALCALNQKVLDDSIRAPDISVQQINYPTGDGGCSAAQIKLLKAELDKAKAMLTKAHDVMTPASEILEDFLTKEWRNDEITNPFKNGMKMMIDCIDGTTKPVEFEITCDLDNVACKEPGAVAYTEKKKNSINLCKGFWELKKAADVENPRDPNQKLGAYDSQGLQISFAIHFYLDSPSKKYGSNTVVAARALIHEFFHIEKFGEYDNPLTPFEVLLFCTIVEGPIMTKKQHGRRIC